MFRDACLRGFLFVVLLSARYALALPPEGRVIWEAGTGDLFPAWAGGESNFAWKQFEGLGFALEIEADTDPYQPREWHIPLDLDTESGREGFVVELRFVDAGAGLIEARLIGGEASPRRKSNYTRLNTLGERSAWFDFDAAGDVAPLLALTGMQYLRKVRVLPGQPEAVWIEKDATVPKDVAPMYSLERPMQLVVSAGVDVRGGLATLQHSLDSLNEFAPLARVLGFTAIESYVTWKRLEPGVEGGFDFAYYDAIVGKLQEYGLKWFPLLIVGSGYALPDWFRGGPEDAPFTCLEHGLSNPIQSIWSPYHARHVTRVLEAFGAHYEPMGVLEGVRLGPSGNYGESQYPAGGNWGPEGEAMHIHIGWWAGDPFGQGAFRKWLAQRYGDIAALNAAWESDYAGFEAVETMLPEHMLNRRARLDFTEWYTDSMSDWCGFWVEAAHKAMPGTKIYQSAGGWGFREAGTDYTAQAKAMIDVEGGIRLTNETDSYEQNFYATRLAATAARLYGIDLGYEPASSHTARGVVGRLFNTAATNGDHFFTYHGNLFDSPMAIAKWAEALPILDFRQDPVIDVAVYYPETMNQIEDSLFRYLYAWGFNPRAAAVRRVVEVDYLDERLLREGYLDRYKALVMVWGDIIEADVIDAVDAWVRKGGTLFYPPFPRGPLSTVEGDVSVFGRWKAGDTGEGSFHAFRGDMEPPSLYGEFIGERLRANGGLHPGTLAALNTTRPEQVFLSVQEDGHMLALNYSPEPAEVALAGQFRRMVAPYSIERIPLPGIR